MREAFFDEYLSFPASREVEEHLDYLTKLSRSIEGVEQDFDIEFSCGDNKYLSDLENSETEFLKYDGNVCTQSVPRFRDTNEQFKPNKPYRFTIRVSADEEEVVFYINGKERSRRMND